MKRGGVWIRLLGAALVGGVGLWGAETWSQRARFLPQWLETEGARALEARFGPHVRTGAVRFLARGAIEIEDLAVPAPEAIDPARPHAAPSEAAYAAGLALPLVRIELDPLRLLGGVLRVRQLVLRGGTLPLRETEAGFTPDFHVEPPAPDEDEDDVPDLDVEGVRIVVRPRPGSVRFAEHATIEGEIVHLDAREDPEHGFLRVVGSLVPIGVGDPEARVDLQGHVDASTGAFSARAEWDPLRLAPELLHLLAPAVAEPLRQQSMSEGRLVILLDRGANVTEGGARLRATWSGAMKLAAADFDRLPDTLVFDAQTRQQLADLFGRGVLRLELEGERVGISRLFSELAGGEVSASGWMERESGRLELEFHIRRLALDDPALRKSLGKEGLAIYDQFAPSGWVDAVGRITRDAAGTLDWHVDVLLEGASFRFFGEPAEGGIRDGFPYPIRDATGRVRITPNEIRFDEIVGFHRSTEIRILGHDTGRTWTDGPFGTETGRIRLGGAGPDIRLTIEVKNMPFDEYVFEAIQGSVFSDMLEEFQLEGVVDQVDLDILAYPGIDTSAKTEVRIRLEGEQVRYRPFPLPLEDVRGTMWMRRPVLPNGTRGRTYELDVEGWADGARARLHMELIEHEKRGRIRIEADEIDLEGRIADVAISSELTGASVGSVWRWLAPRGKANVVADLPLAEDPAPLSFRADLHGASLALDAEDSPAPLRIENAAGVLAIEGDRIRLEEMSGQLGGTTMFLQGDMQGGPTGSWSLSAQADRMRLDEALLRGVRHLLQTDSLLPGGLDAEPGGTLDLALVLTREGDQPIEARGTAKRVATQVRLPDGTRAEVRAESLQIADGVVEATGLAIERDGLQVEVERGWVRPGEGGEQALEGRISLRLDRHRPAADELGLLPEAVREVLVTWAGRRRISSQGLDVTPLPGGGVRLEGPLAFHAEPGEADLPGPLGRIVFAPLLVVAENDQPTVLSGRVRLVGFTPDAAGPASNLHGWIAVERFEAGAAGHGTATLEHMQGQVGGVAFANLAGPVTMRENILEAPSLAATIAGGRMTGQFAWHLAQPQAFRGRLRCEGVRLEHLAATIDGLPERLAGELSLDCAFENPGGDLAHTAAVGALRVRRGWLGEMPAARSLPTLLGSAFSGGSHSAAQAPFTDAYATFALQHGLLRLPQAFLAGRGFTLPGRGTIDLVGESIDMTFTPDVLKHLLLPGAMQDASWARGLRRLLPESGLYHVRLAGPLDQAEPVLVPFYERPRAVPRTRSRSSGVAGSPR